MRRALLCGFALGAVFGYAAATMVEYRNCLALDMGHRWCAKTSSTLSWVE